MKRPLQHMFYAQKFRLKTAIFAMMSIIVSIQLASAQTTVYQSECFCLGNATTASNGQYRDTVIINSGISGQTWRLQNAVGFYNVQSSAPPASPVLYFNNTILSEFAPGRYRIVGKRITGQSWSFLASNTTTGQAIPVASQQSCSYPTTTQMTITGDGAPCPGQSLSYSIPANANLSNIIWTVSGGTITAGAGTNAVTISWGTTPGNYALSVAGDLRSFATQSRPCPIVASRVVTITDLASATAIVGDIGNCVGSSKEYTLAERNYPRNVIWTVTLDAAGNIPSGITPQPKPNDTRTRIIQWPSTPGTYYVRAVGEYSSTLNSTNYCPFTSVQEIVVTSEATVSLSCNGSVNLSMNPNCRLSFSPGQFLTHMPLPETSYDIVIRDIETNTIIPNGTVGLQYVGKTLEVMIVHECSGNACWGYVNIEDKSIPDLVCPSNAVVGCQDISNLSLTGMPTFPAGVTVIPVVGTTNKFTVLNYDRCSSLTLEYTDVAQSRICTGPYSSIISRTWKITDANGNTSVCTQTISVPRATLDDVTIPGNWDSSTGPFPTLEACGNYAVIPADPSFPNNPNAGHPHPDYTGYPSGTLCLNASVSFVDTELPICGDHTYKIVRKWTITDHCDSRVIVRNQLITVMDSQAPVINCPTVTTTLQANINACGGDFTVPAPNVTNECGKTTWTADFLVPGTTSTYVSELGSTRVVKSGTRVTIVNLPSGTNTIRYIVTDDCGNSSTCSINVSVEDKIKPTPVCDKNSVVAIGSDGSSLMGVNTINEGSNDNCEIDCIKVRRMDNANPVSFSTLEKNNLTRFTCADVGKLIMVEMMVYDKSDNFSSCMTEVRVQDNINPVITVPASITRPCTANFSNLSTFGTATATDNCSASVVEGTPTITLNDCGVGTIVRRFTATDSDGNTATGTQTITVTNSLVFDANDINWPDTYNPPVGSCANRSHPDDLPTAFARPIILRDTACSELDIFYEDVVFQFQDGVCTKILRTWTVIDNCQTSPSNPNAGVFKNVQLLMFTNTTAPKISKGCQATDLTITPSADACGANVKITAEGNDDCTDSLDLVWKYTIDEGNNGSLEVSNGTGRTINRNFSNGTHKITWTVTDGCNNSFTCSNVFTIKDEKKPTPVCLDEIVTVIMPSTKSVNIWASDFILASSVDNCSASNKLAASFHPTNRNDISRTFNCDSLAGAANKDFTLKVYVIDEAGNSDFCTVSLRVQDNGTSCNPNNTPENLVIKGNIYNELAEQVKDVDVLLQTNLPEFPKNSMTNLEGKFAFSDLPMYQDYDLVPTKNDNPLNGVSTLDLVMIQRHIIGLSLLDSPYKLIAADVNNSEKISAADLVELRKLILGIVPSFQNNKSWRFVDVSHTFADKTNPWPFVERAYMSALDHDVAGLDFMAVKIGDVNGTANANGVSSGNVSNRTASSFMTDKVTAGLGETFEMTIKSEEIAKVVGLQHTFVFDPSIVELVDIKSDKIQLNADNIGLIDLAKGVINVSWSTIESINLEGEIFKLTFRAKKPIENAEIISIAQEGLASEIYTAESNKNLSIKAIGLSYNHTFSTEQFELFQNIPNPFNSTTQIGFVLPQAEKVNLKVYDLTGKLLYNVSGDYGKGYNTISLDINDLVTNGVLYYQLETQGHSAKRKMIVIK